MNPLSAIGQAITNYFTKPQPSGLISPLPQGQTSPPNTKLLSPLPTAPQQPTQFQTDMTNIGHVPQDLLNGVHNATIGFDKFFGAPDNRSPWNRLPQPNPQSPQQPLSAMAQSRAMAQPQITPTITPNVNQHPMAMRQASVQTQPNIPTFTPPQGMSAPQGAFGGFTTAPVPENLQGLIYHAAQQAGVDPNIFASILFSEHGFQLTPGYNYNPDGSYDRGIAQINTKSHPEVTDEQALNPNFAVPYAANMLGRYIQQVKQRGGDLNQGIAAYNVGVGGAFANNGSLGPRGQRYLDAVSYGLTPETIKKLGLRPSPRPVIK